MALGRTLNNGRYNLVEKLGTGGMSVVWRAEDSLTGSEVAIKVLKPEYARDARVKKRFEDEAVLMSRIEHPNIVRVFDVGQDGEHLYIVMEIVAFGSLAEFLKLEGPLPPRWASELLQSVLEGLQIAHDAGITHRDIKPQNILLTDEGVPKLSDFGIARLVDTDSTVTGQRLGTPAYMSPEQLRNSKSVDHRADLYSCAATLYTLVTGREAFDLSSPIREDVLGQLPPALAKVIGRGSHHDPAGRYPSATGMRDALGAVHDTLEEDTLNLPALPKAPRGEPTMALEVLKLDPPRSAPQTDEDFEDLDREDDADAITEREPVATKRRNVDESEEPESAPPPTPLDRLKQLPVPLWFLGVVASSVVLFFGTIAIYIVLSMYSAATVVTKANTETAAAAAQQQAAASLAPAPAEAIPEGVLEAEALKDAQEAPKVSYGSLAVRSRPTSEVSIDGKSKGYDSWAGKVTAGTHRLVFRSGDGKSHSASVKVKGGGTTSYCWDFAANAICE